MRSFEPRDREAHDAYVAELRRRDRRARSMWALLTVMWCLALAVLIPWGLL